MTDAALAAIPVAAPTSWKARRGARCAGCSQRKGAVVGLVVIATFIAARGVCAADRAL